MGQWPCQRGRKKSEFTANVAATSEEGAVDLGQFRLRPTFFRVWPIQLRPIWTSFDFGQFLDVEFSDHEGRPEGWGAQNFALFFPFSRCCFHSFLGGLARNFGGFDAGALKCARLGSQAVVCEPQPVWWGRWGFTRQPESPNVHISGPRHFKHHQNSTRRPPRERRKNEISGGREKKKREILGPPPFSPHPFGPPPFGADLAKVGQSRFGQSPSNQDGQSLSQP